MIMKPIETTTNHVSGVLLLRTTLPILSLIDVKVWPGSMSGASGNSRAPVPQPTLDVEFRWTQLLPGS
jgi:hypothetical protein